MNLKNTFVAITLFIFSGIGYAQDYKSEIKKEFGDYLDLILAQDFEKSMEYVIDDVFEIVAKEDMISLMESTFNTPGLELSMEQAKIISVGDKELVEEKFYTLLSYSNIMKMKFLEEAEEENNEEDNRTEEELAKDEKIKNALVRVSLAKTFGDENVKFNEDSKVYEIFVIKQAYAISENGNENWKFIVAEKNQKAFLELILPKAIVDKI